MYLNVTQLWLPRLFSIEPAFYQPLLSYLNDVKKGDYNDVLVLRANIALMVAARNSRIEHDVVGTCAA